MFGWKNDALQKAMDDNGCFSATCGGLKSQDITIAKKCTIKKTVNEEVDGCKLNGFAVFYTRAHADESCRVCNHPRYFYG